MFKYFKLTSKNRKNVIEPKNWDTWIKHGFSEFIGTIIISLLLAGLSVVVFQKGNSIKVVEHYLVHSVLVGLYAGFVAVGLVLVIFLRWSCDLNPAISLTRMLNGTNTYKYGIFKIFLQIIGGIIAGLIIYGFGHIHNSNKELIANQAIDAIMISKKAFIGIGHGSINLGSLWIFFGELIATSILLFSIFSKRISNNYRDLFIMLIISCAVFMALHIGSVALNPARGLAQQVPALFFGIKIGNSSSKSSLIWATILMFAGSLLSAIFYVFMQGFADKFSNLLSKVINFKNFKVNNMKTL